MGQRWMGQPVEIEQNTCGRNQQIGLGGMKEEREGKGRKGKEGKEKAINHTEGKEPHGRLRQKNG